MSLTTITTAHMAPRRRSRLLAVALAAVLAAGTGATLASSGLKDSGRPAKPAAWPSGPIEFNDPAVVKGARGGKTNTRTFPFEVEACVVVRSAERNLNKPAIGRALRRLRPFAQSATRVPRCRSASGRR